MCLTKKLGLPATGGVKAIRLKSEWAEYLQKFEKDKTTRGFIRTGTPYTNWQALHKDAEAAAAREDWAGVGDKLPALKTALAQLLPGSAGSSGAVPTQVKTPTNPQPVQPVQPVTPQQTPQQAAQAAAAQKAAREKAAHDEALTASADLRRRAADIQALDPSPVNATLLAEWNDALARHKDAMAAPKWDVAQKALADVERVARALEESLAERAKFQTELKRYTDRRNKAREQVDLGTPCPAQESWSAAAEAVRVANLALTWPQARTALADLERNLTEVIRQALIARKAAETGGATGGTTGGTASAAAKPDPQKALHDTAFEQTRAVRDDAAQVRSASPCPADAAACSAWDQALATHAAAVKGSKWGDARQALATVETAGKALIKARDDKALYETAYKAYTDRLANAPARLRTGPSAPDHGEWKTAAEKVKGEASALRWGPARLAVAPLGAALEKVIQAIDAQKQAYETAYGTLKAVCDPALAVRTAQPCPADAAAQDAWDKAEATRSAAASAEKWTEARATLAAVDAAAKRLLKARDDKVRHEADYKTYTDELAKAPESLRAGPAPTHGAWVAALKKVNDEAAACRWETAQKAVPALLAALRPVVADTLKAEQEKAQAAVAASTVTPTVAKVSADPYQAYLDAKDQAKSFAAFDAHAGGVDGADGTLLTRWNTLRSKWVGHHNGKRWVEAKQAVVDLDAVAKDLLAQIAARADYDAAYDKSPNFKAYESNRTEYGKAAAAGAPFFAKREVWRLAYNANQWAEAKAALPDVESGAAIIVAAKPAYDQFAATATTAANAIVQEAEGLHDASKGSDRMQRLWGSAFNAVVPLKNGARWVEAKDAFTKLLALSRSLIDEAALLTDYDDPTKEAIAKADELAMYPLEGTGPAATAYKNFVRARDTFNKALLADNFKLAKTSLPPVKSTAAAYVSAMSSSSLDDKKAYEAAWKTVEPKVTKARDIKGRVKDAVAALEPEWRMLTAADDVRTQAVTATHWAKANATLGVLGRSAARIDELHAAFALYDGKFAAIKATVAAAAAIAAEGLAHLATVAEAFSELQRATLGLSAAGRFADAEKNLAELERRAKALIEKDKQGGAKGTADGDRMRTLSAEAKALRTRVVMPALGLEESARKPVVDALDAAARLLSGASVDVGKAAAEVEKAKKAFEAALAARKSAWETFYAQARKEVDEAKASASGLDDKLKAQQAKGIEATRVSIEKAVQKGHYGAATAKAKGWAAEARAWAQAKDAAASLQPGPGKAPDLDKLKALAGQDGGGKVLDALVAGLIADKKASSAVLKAALEARFGFKAKRYDQRDKKAGESDVRGLAQLGPGADKTLEQTYQVLAKVPQGKWSGKVDDLITYDRNSEKSLGGHYSSGAKKKIYMYCGRPTDANEQTFGKNQKVVPEGEAIEDSCQPTSEAAVPLFDFTLLHEAGHAEDEQATYMGRNGSKADHGGWRSHAGPEDFIDAVAGHFKYDKAYILATLKSPNGAPPAQPAATPKNGNAGDWEKARADAVAWCRSVRVDAQVWENPSLTRAVAIGGRVYQEAYAGQWVSYDLAARARGISSYQFRAPGEWFAELYAAYFSKKLKPSHPSAAWLKTFKSPAAART